MRYKWKCDIRIHYADYCTLCSGAWGDVLSHVLDRTTMNALCQLYSGQAMGEQPFPPPLHSQMVTSS